MPARLHEVRLEPRSKRSPQLDYSGDVWLHLLMDGTYCTRLPDGVSALELYGDDPKTPDAFDQLSTEQLLSVEIFNQYRHEYIDSAGVWLLPVVREAYEYRRTDLLAAWVAQYPGSRPEPWWMFEAHEPRRMLIGYPLHKRPGAGVRIGGGAAIPPCWVEHGDQHIEFETELQYLQRNDLLFPNEMKARRWLEFSEPRGSYIRSDLHLASTVQAESGQRTP